MNEIDKFLKECRALRLKGATEEQWEYAEKLGQACVYIDQLQAKERIEKMDKYRLKEHNSDEQMNWDSNDDTRAHLTVGAVYDAEVEVHKWHRKFLINGKKYNSVCFELAT